MNRLKGLILILLFGFISVILPFMGNIVWADELINGTEISWSYDSVNRVLNFKGIGAIPSYEKFVDESGNTVGEESPWEKYAGSVKYIIIGDGITEIGKHCFKDFSKLVSVNIPGSVEIIMDAFPENNELTVRGNQLTAAEILAYENNYVFIPFVDFGRGDANLDSVFDVKDALYVLEICAKIEPLYGYTADANSDGKVSVRDALLLLKHSAKLLPTEEIEIKEYDTCSIVLGEPGYKPEKVTCLESHYDYIKYVKQFFDIDSDKENQFSELFYEHEFEYKDVIAIYIENEDWDNIEQQLINVIYDGFVYTVNLNSYISETANKKPCATCFFMKVPQGMDMDHRTEINIVEEKEIDADIEVNKSEVSKVSVDEFETGAQLVSDYETYKKIIEDNFAEKSKMDICSEEFFKENSLLVVKELTDKGKCLNIIPQRLSKTDNAYKLYADRVISESYEDEVLPWISFIAVTKEMKSNPKVIIEYDDYIVQGFASEIGEAKATTNKISRVSLANKIITEYSDYLEYLKTFYRYKYGKINYLNKAYGYTEEFFEENSLIIMNHTEYRSGSIEITYNRMEKVEDIYKIHIDAHFPAGHTDDVAQWLIVVPVEGKDWDEKQIEIVSTDIYEWE